MIHLIKKAQAEDLRAEHQWLGLGLKSRHMLSGIKQFYEGHDVHTIQNPKRKIKINRKKPKHLTRGPWASGSRLGLKIAAIEIELKATLFRPRCSHYTKTEKKNQGEY
jgi:hypothetical protein